MARKTVVPADARLLVFRRHGSQVGGVEAGEEFPNLLHRLQENDVRVDVEQRVHLLQDQLESGTQSTHCLHALVHVQVYLCCVMEEPMLTNRQEEPLGGTWFEELLPFPSIVLGESDGIDGEVEFRLNCCGPGPQLQDKPQREKQHINNTL